MPVSDRAVRCAHGVPPAIRRRQSSLREISSSSCAIRIVFQSIRRLAVRRPRLLGTHLPALLLLEEHSLAVPGLSVPFLGRRYVEIIEDDNPQRGG